MNPSPATLYEDEHLLVLNKPSGLLTEGGDRESDLEQIATALADKPVYCCHRLDRLTSGVVLLRKTARYQAELAALFELRQVRKFYWAVVEGAWPAGLNKIETQIAATAPGRFANVTSGGKPAVSTFRVLGASADRSLTWMGVLLKTGRTHQIRLHCQQAGCPVVGDPLYGSGQALPFFGLHARELKLRHPATQQELTLIAPPPANWPAWINPAG